MSDAFWQALFSNGAAILMGLGSMVASIIVAMRAKASAAKQKEAMTSEVARLKEENDHTKTMAFMAHQRVDEVGTELEAVKSENKVLHDFMQTDVFLVATQEFKDFRDSKKNSNFGNLK